MHPFCFAFEDCKETKRKLSLVTQHRFNFKSSHLDRLACFASESISKLLVNHYTLITVNLFKEAEMNAHETDKNEMIIDIFSLLLKLYSTSFAVCSHYIELR